MLGIYKPYRIHHPNCNDPTIEKEKLQIVLNQMSVNFTVALDTEWNTIKNYWTNSTGVYSLPTIVIDKNRVIQSVQALRTPLLPDLGDQAEAKEFEILERKINAVL